MMCHFEHAKMESFWICCQSDHPVYSYWKPSLWTETPTQWSLSVLCAISLSCPVLSLTSSLAPLCPSQMKFTHAVSHHSAFVVGGGVWTVVELRPKSRCVEARSCLAHPDPRMAGCLAFPRALLAGKTTALATARQSFWVPLPRERCGKVCFSPQSLGQELLLFRNRMTSPKTGRSFYRNLVVDALQISGEVWFGIGIKRGFSIWK